MKEEVIEECLKELLTAVDKASRRLVGKSAEELLSEIYPPL